MSRYGPRQVKRLVTGGLNKAHALTDTFRSLDTAKWSSNANASVVGWRGRLTLPAVGSTAAFGTGTAHYDLTNSFAHVEFATLPTFNTSSVYLQARLDANNHVFIGRESGNLLMRKVTAGVVSDTTLTYDYTFHRWVRLRHDGTNLLWETSNNGTTWTTRRTDTVSFALTNVEIRIEALWLGTAGVGVAEFAWFNSTPATPLSYSPPPYHFGSLQTQSWNVSGERSGGTRLAMQELFWNLYETGDNVFSGSEISWKQTERTDLLNAGQKVTLGLGMHNPPSYVGSLTNAKYVDQSGNVSGQNNFVFNQLVRDKAERYITRVHADLNLANYWCIRLTSGGNAEALYPGGGAFWAYDTNAQTGAPNLPVTIAPCPYPGWVPGNTSITTAQARDWAEWYIASLADSINWQIRFIRGLGFTGWFEIVMPGQGTRPTQWETDIAARLSPSTTTTGVGAVWHKLVEKIVDRHGCVAYCSSMADNSGSNDVPTSTDVNTVITSSGVNGWSAARWIKRLGDEFLMAFGGENPGYGDTGASYYTDTSSAGMAAQAFNQLIGAKALSFYWAHSNRLWDGTMPMANYATRISAANPSGAGTPPNPP